ncbi:predicted protein [Streptomyces viridosporus ATCC 14672]|uniref:Predicted protein n=1 Tax=Streptomyces viridosporus (strain ATCC 14672 / DSM 40746 / JCM 4963 / KCTC 9882 / NRRL B-12104 / FH 1290) TaxID=566461 RepID=D5ZNT4_STRV1|nr:predicted protein [Streptomyces viridosporus ATCC 14672]
MRQTTHRPDEQPTEKISEGPAGCHRGGDIEAGVSTPTPSPRARLCRLETHRCCSEWVGRATVSSWNPVRMLVSLVYHVARKLLSVPAVLLRRRAPQGC